MAYDLPTKTQAVARVMAGTPAQHVADGLGVPCSTVTRWVHAAARKGTQAETELAQAAEDFAVRIVAQQEKARSLLLDRIVALAPQTDNVRDAAWAYGVLTDKALLAAGKPTTITGQAVAIPDGATSDELVSIADELRRRREQAPA